MALRLGAIPIHLEVLVGGVLVAVDLHVGHVSLLWGHGLVHLLGRGRVKYLVSAQREQRCAARQEMKTPAVKNSDKVSKFA